MMALAGIDEVARHLEEPLGHWRVAAFAQLWMGKAREWTAVRGVGEM